MNLSKQTKLLHVSPILAAGSTTNSLGTSVVDTQGYEGVRFMTTIGAVASTPTLTVQAATSTTAADFADYTTSITAASTVASRILAVTVHRPTKRYARCTWNTTGANLVGGVIAELYGSHIVPTTNASTDVSAEGFGIST